MARPARAQARIGATTSQGDAAMESDFFRTAQGIDGTGLTIGTLSSSYDCLIGAVANVGTGDLPGVGHPSGYVTPVEVLDDSACPSTDEGRAMMQLIHDVAPGAAQSFHSVFGGQAAFALGIEELAGCPSGATIGCTPAATAADIIDDDDGYFTEPFFQDGIIAQAVDLVAGAGVAYFSSAGNSGRKSYEAPFRPGLDADRCGLGSPVGPRFRSRPR